MSLVNTTSVQYTLYPTVAMTFTVCPFDTIRDCEGPTTLMLIYNPNATPKYSSFIKNALAIVDTTHNTYMVKEVIDEAVHGAFVKYIGNGSVKPYEFLGGPAVYWAEYEKLSLCSTCANLCFSGGTCLLMDPQIITSLYVSL